MENFIPPESPNAAERFIYGITKYARSSIDGVASRLCTKTIPDLEKSIRKPINALRLKHLVDARVKFEKGYIDEETFWSFVRGDIDYDLLNAYARVPELLDDQNRNFSYIEH